VFATVDPNQLSTAILNLRSTPATPCPTAAKLILETRSRFSMKIMQTRTATFGPAAMPCLRQRHRNRHPRCYPRQGVQPVLHVEGTRQGHRPRLKHGLRLREAIRGAHQDLQRGRHGTTIKIYLPPGTGASLAPEAAIAPAIQGGHETILVVEDDKLVREYVLTQLRSLGYVTLDAANGAEALAIIAAGNHFDLLFNRRDHAGCNEWPPAGHRGAKEQGPS